jgi:hypothetical protein
MKSLPLVALIFAAFCTGAAITAYVLIGSTDDYEPHGHVARPETAAEPGPAAPNAPSPSLQSSAPLPQGSLAARRTLTPNADTITTAPAPAAVLHHGPQSSTPTGPSAVQARFPSRNHAPAGIPQSKSIRFGVSAPPSDRVTPISTRNDTQEATSSKSTNPKSAKSALPPVETSTPQTLPPDSETASHPNNIAPGKRAPWPRGNFSVEDERARAQMGWRAFADEIFEASVNPSVSETTK